MAQETSREIIIGIPGLWPTRTDLIRSVVSKTDGLLLVGPILYNQKARKHFQADIYEHDSLLRQAFSFAGMGQIPEQDLEAVASHTYTLYLIGPAGTPDLAQEMLEVTAQLLNAGGLAVKVETAGVAHTKEAWQHFADHGHMLLCDAYTAYIGTKDRYYSCGMHNLGLPDASVSTDLTMKDALRLLKVFLRYTVIEHPSLGDSHTFSLDADSPPYRLTHQECTAYPPDDPFYNPFGLWHLSRVE